MASLIPWVLRIQRSGQDHVDIITFYNEIFIPSVKPLLVEIGPAGSTMKTDRVPQVNNDSDGTLDQVSFNCNDVLFAVYYLAYYF